MTCQKVGKFVENACNLCIECLIVKVLANKLSYSEVRDDAFVLKLDITPTRENGLKTFKVKFQKPPRKILISQTHN